VGAAKNVRYVLPFLLFAASVAAAGCSPISQTSAQQAPPPPPFVYVDTWGSDGDGPGQFDKPVAIASDGESIIYVADAATGFIHKFSASGGPRLSFQDDRFNLKVADLAVDAGAAIYVADSHRGVVLVYFSDGLHHREVRVGAASAVRESMHIAVDPYGTLFVTARHPFGVRKFSPALRAAGAWGGAAAREAAVDNPASLAVGPDGLVYLAESERPQVVVYNAAGVPQRTLSLPAGAPEARLSGVAVNRRFAFAVDALRPSVYVWGLDGSYRLTADLSAWIPTGSGADPRKITLTPAGDLLVLDPEAARVFRFHLHPESWMFHGA
jgi:DNA-binding beta-propeller fold protein YncE